jgi:hypothetical protein
LLSWFHFSLTVIMYTLQLTLIHWENLRWFLMLVSGMSIWAHLRSFRLNFRMLFADLHSVSIFKSLVFSRTERTLRINSPRQSTEDIVGYILVREIRVWNSSCSCKSILWVILFFFICKMYEIFTFKLTIFRKYMQPRH